MKKTDYNFRSACALGIISYFVLFLTASAPHRVHHLFENLPKTHGHDRHAHPSIQSGTTSVVDLTPTTMSILRAQLALAPRITTKITTAPRKRFVSFRAPHSIHIYPMLS